MFPTLRWYFVREPLFSPSYFDLEMGRVPIARESRTKNNHAMNVCRNLTPMVDTLLSLHKEVKDPNYEGILSTSMRIPAALQVESIASQFKGVSLATAFIGNLCLI